MLQLPLAGTVKGFGETAPAGRPDTVILSPGVPRPHTMAGVIPPDHASFDARTMYEVKSGGCGPHAVGGARGDDHDRT